MPLMEECPRQKKQLLQRQPTWHVQGLLMKQVQEEWTHSDLFAFSNSEEQVRKAIMVAAGGEIWRKDVKKIFQHLVNVGREQLIWTPL